MTNAARTFARKLRQQQTSAEDILWRALRGRGLGGHKFRRQVPIGAYVVDFLCCGAKLVVEIDGKQHAAEAEYDDRRTAEIESQGFSVIRFTNTQARERLDDVLRMIELTLKER